MNKATITQDRIEQILREEFEADGYQVINEMGNFVALVETFSTEGFHEYTKFDLTNLAKQIDARLS